VNRCDAVIAGMAGAVLSGVPSTLHALVRGDDPLAGARAAGALLLPREQRTPPLLAAAVPAHLALSLGWAVVLDGMLPRGWEVEGGVVGGLAIAALDLGVIGRRLAPIRALPPAPQVADHVAYGAVVGAVLARRRRSRASREPVARP
jgi:hypothetical protein